MPRRSGAVITALRVMQQRFLVLESARHLLRVRDKHHELDRR